ncbi:MAG: CTP synthase [Clostridia bacterium]|nr:CTP synthase [Clostridia bacterium]
MAVKYVFVTGGVVSSLGKGITAASLGRLLKARGLKVSMQKMDPYYNVEPGLLSPLQHGEAFITADGVAADLDLGHYERFIDDNLRGEASVTTGKVLKSIMDAELQGQYKGGTIQVIPHVTNEIKKRIRQSAVNSGSDIAIIEIGGTVGDMESAPYLEAIRQFGSDIGRGNCCYIHVTLLPYVSVAMELKTKPTQHSVKDLRSIGIQPDIIVCRSQYPIQSDAKEKIALFCSVKRGHVVQNHDVSALYEVPLMLEKEGLADIVLGVLHMKKRVPDLTGWQQMVNDYLAPKGKLKVALVGKYVALHDAYLSVAEALTHAGIAHRQSLEMTWIASDDLTESNAGKLLARHDAIIVPGGYGDRGAEGIITALRYARTHKVPLLAIGFGMQLAVVEACRNLLGLTDANSTEVAPDCRDKVIRIPPERVCDNDSRGASRMGGYAIKLVDGLAMRAYGTDQINERHGNRYEVENSYVAPLEKKGFIVTGRCVEADYPEIFEYQKHPYYLAVIFHPEYQSRPNKPHPLFLGLIGAAKARKDAAEAKTTSGSSRRSKA